MIDGILSRWLDRGSVPAWKSVAEYERDAGHEVNQSFRIGWAAARTRMSHIERPARRSARIATALYRAGWLAVIAACVWFFYVIALCLGG
jgi:hypothetical protein